MPIFLSAIACSVMISIWEWRMPCVLRNRSTSGFVQRPSLMARYAYLHASIIAVYISLLDRGGLDAWMGSVLRGVGCRCVAVWSVVGGCGPVWAVGGL